MRDVVEEPATLSCETPLAVLDVEPDVPVDDLIEELPDDDPVEDDTPLDVGGRLEVEEGGLDVEVLDAIGEDVDVVGGLLLSLAPSPSTSDPVVDPVAPALLATVFEVVVETGDVVAATGATLVELSPTARAKRRRRSPMTTVGLMPRNTADVSESGIAFWAATTRAMATHKRAMTAARKGHRSGVGL